MREGTRDSHRMWMWWFLAIVAASQLYVFWELLAALFLFVVACAPIALLIASFYVLQNGWVMALARFAQISILVVNVASRREKSNEVAL